MHHALLASCGAPHHCFPTEARAVASKSAPRARLGRRTAMSTIRKLIGYRLIGNENGMSATVEVEDR